MKAEIRNRPDYASLHIELDEGEQVVTETGAMMGMDPALKMDTNMKGGLLGAAKRALGGETVFQNTYTSTGPAQQLDVAPSIPGDMEEIELANTGVVVQRGAYVACTPDIEVTAKWGGAKTFFGGEGLFMLKCSGTGKLWIASFGAIHKVDVEGGYTVDTSHIVAFDESLTFTVTKVGGLKSLFLSQEGLVCAFSGTGRLWIQTRNAPALASFLHPFRKVQKSND
ncbi:MAG: TIGR00266 family protein [Deltaproteobacteria bacterium]|nr:TIGR00266 family protein [Deltaproteobacteria bacterium]MBW2257302.1 TIGR00266 family protein [Deltaproteobacteria bacterium]